MRELPVVLRWYLVAVYLACVAAVGAQIAAFLSGPVSIPAGMLLAVLVFIALAYAGERLTLRVSVSVDQTLATPVHIAAILLFPPPFPALITLCGVLLSQFVHERTPLYKRLFNITHPTLAVAVSGALCGLLIPPTRILHTGLESRELPVLVMLIALYYLFDVGVFLVVLSLLEHRSPRAVWWETYRHTLLPELATGATGIFAAVIWRYNPLLLVLVVLPVAALHHAFRAIIQAEDRAMALQRRSEQQNAVLEAGQHMQLLQSHSDLLGPVVEAAQAIMGASAVGIYMQDQPRSPLLHRVAEAGIDTESSLPASIPSPADVSDLNDQARGVMAVPLAHAGCRITALLLLAGLPPDITDDSRDALAILVNQAAIALDNARLYAEAQEARGLAERAVRVRDEFLTVASHDLRTPLTNIVGRSALVHMRLDQNGTVDMGWLRTQIESLRKAADRMVATVEEITDAAQLQMGQHLSLRLAPLNLNALVHDVVSTIVQDDHTGRCPIAIDLPSEPVIIHGDRMRLERVLQNVVDNAIKYGTPGEPVHIAVGRHDGQGTIRVQNHGVGIPEDELPFIFTHFYRASTSRGIAGTGIGLAGCKMIVEQHGGRIDLESMVDHGTIVTISLPCRPAA